MKAFIKEDRWGEYLFEEYSFDDWKSCNSPERVEGQPPARIFLSEDLISTILKADDWRNDFKKTFIEMFLEPSRSLMDKLLDTHISQGEKVINRTILNEISPRISYGYATNEIEKIRDYQLSLVRKTAAKISQEHSKLFEDILSVLRQQGMNNQFIKDRISLELEILNRVLKNVDELRWAFESNLSLGNVYQYFVNNEARFRYCWRELNNGYFQWDQIDPEWSDSTHPITFYFSLIDYQKVIESKQIDFSMFDEKELALYHWIQINLGKEPIIEKSRDGFWPKKLIMTLAQNRYSCNGQSFYKYFTGIDITNKTAIARSSRRDFKQRLITMSGNSSDVIQYLKDFPS